MDMPPPSLPVRRPALAAKPRVLPPVPVEPAVAPEHSQPQPSAALVAAVPVAANPAAASAAASASDAAASTAAVAVAAAPAQPKAVAAPKPAPAPVVVAPPSSVYTLPLWSAAPLHTWSLDVIKDGRQVESIALAGKSHFLLGRAGDLCDVVLDHASISRRHCVLQFHENGTLWLFDLGTAHGTFRNKARVAPHSFVQLNPGDQLKFAASTRFYIVEGPEELRPKEIDRDLLRKHNATMQQQHAERQQQQRLQQARQARSGDGETADSASWGQGEDAVNSEDEEDEGKVASVRINDDGSTSVVASSSGGGGTGALPAKLTPQQRKWMDKLEQKREKLNNLANEVETLRSKDIRQGGLTEGQERQIAKNEERMRGISDEVDQLEKQLRESVDRVASDREKNQNAIDLRSGKKKAKVDSDDDDAGGNDSDDDFYDRTKSKPHVQAGATATSSSTVTSIVSTLTPLSALTTPEAIAAELKRIEAKRDQLRLTLQEVVVSEQKAKRVQGGGADTLDSFMSTISTEALSSRKASIKASLQELQTHHVKLQRLAEQKKGEVLTQRYMAGDKDAFKQQPATAESKGSNVAPMEIEDATPSAPAAARVSGPSLPPAAAHAASPAAPAASTGGVSSTADMLARMKKKQEAAARKAAEKQASIDKLDEMKRVLDAASPAAGTGRAVQAFAAETPTTPALDRYALLAQQLEAARGAVHRNYDAVGDDAVSLALKASASRSAASMSTGLSGQEAQGGLHIRKRADGDEQGDHAAKRAKPAAPTFSGPRMVGPSGPMVDETLERQQTESSVEWTPPVQATSAQAALRAKFAGKY